jgi:hypothetical protein
MVNNHCKKLLHDLRILRSRKLRKEKYEYKVPGIVTP